MTSKQDYEEVAAHDAQRRVDPYDGIDDAPRWSALAQVQRPDQGRSGNMVAASEEDPLAPHRIPEQPFGHARDRVLTARVCRGGSCAKVGGVGGPI